MATLNIDLSQRERRAKAKERFEAFEIAGICIAFTMAFALQSLVTLVAGTFFCLIFAFRYRHLVPLNLDVTTKGLILLLLFSPAFFKPGFGFSPIFYLFTIVVTFATAFVMSRFSGRTLLLAANTIYWVFAVLVGLILLIYWGTKEPFAQVIEGSSTNGIPAYMILIQLFLCTITYFVTGRAPVITPALTFLIAFYGNGRGSIIVGAILIFGSLVINLFPRKVPFFYRAALFTLSVAVMAFVIVNAVEILDYVSRYTKLSVGVTDQNRAMILDAYLSKMNPFTFFFGTDYSGTIIEYKHEGNPHISYIRLHAFFGIFALLMAIFSPAIILFSRGSWLLKLPVLFFICLALLRAATEPILFPTLLDVFFFAMFFIFFRARDAAEVRHG